MHAAPGIKCASCRRPAAQGFSHCCRTCEASQGKAHGPRCEAANVVVADAKATRSSVSSLDQANEKWFWGHTDSELEPPKPAPDRINILTLPLKLISNGKYFRDFARHTLCPFFLDEKARHHPTRCGCPFLGGTAYLRHKDVRAALDGLTEGITNGSITRGNELGYLLLDDATFPGVAVSTEDEQKCIAGKGTIFFGNTAEEHVIQKRWLEFLLRSDRLPSRVMWLEHVNSFLDSARHGAKKLLKLGEDVTIWWQQMLWQHLLGCALSWEDADSFVTFQNAWLHKAVRPFPSLVAKHTSDWMGGEQVSSWEVCKVVETQRQYRKKIEGALPAEVPPEHRKLVAQGVLEMFVFVAGLAVPQTIHSAAAVLYSPQVFASPAVIDEENVDVFVYEVTRLFPSVQALCFWRDGNREILSLCAALRDPAVWGDDANKFTFKSAELYVKSHVGFASRSDSKFCPGHQLALDAVCAFMLSLSRWHLADSGETGRMYWCPTAPPTPGGMPKWWGEMSLVCREWWGDQTGEDMIASMGPVELARLHSDMSSQNSFSTVLSRIWPHSHQDQQSHLRKMDLSTRMLYEICKHEYRDLSNHVYSNCPDETPAGPHSRYFKLRFDDVSDEILLPIPGGFNKRIRAGTFCMAHNIFKFTLNDAIDDSLRVCTQQQRTAAIQLLQKLFCRDAKLTASPTPPNGRCRPDSFLPKATPFDDISSDASQVAIARCGMGQLFLSENVDPKLIHYGDIVCDVSELGGFEVRPGFEKLGARAIFKRTSSAWEITAIDWRHGDRIVVPGESQWNHAKWAWRCSLVTYMTIVHHLLWSHWIMSNSFSTSISETLSATHPVRRVLQVSAYFTRRVNYRSAMVLFPESGVVHRMSPFPYSELLRICAAGAETFRVQTWPQVVENTRLPAEVKSSLPIFQDGLQVWSALHAFYSGYVNVYYPTEGHVLADKELHEYWKFSCVPQYARSLPPLSKSSLIDQITCAVFDATAFHQFVGGVSEYTIDPAGAALQIRAGRDMADLQQFVMVNSLVAATGPPMPMFVASGLEGDEEWISQLDFRTRKAKVSKFIAQQIDGHPDVVLRASAPNGSEIARIPNGASVIRLEGVHGEYIKVQACLKGKDLQGWAKMHNFQHSYGDGKAAPDIKCTNCRRPAAKGFSHCCRTCQGSQGKSHGPRCEHANIAAVAHTEEETNVDILPDDTIRWMWEDASIVCHSAATHNPLRWSSTKIPAETIAELAQYSGEHVEQRPVEMVIMRAGSVLRKTRFGTVAGAIVALNPEANEDAEQDFQEVTRLYDELMTELKKVSEAVRARNKSGERERPFCKMDPLTFERSVSL